MIGFTHDLRHLTGCEAKKVKPLKTQKKGKMMRIFTRNGYLYIDSQNGGARVRLATGLKVCAENKAFLAKKGVCELFLKDKTAALLKWREFTDKVWESENTPKSVKAHAKLVKKGDERFFIESVFRKFTAEKAFLKERTRANYAGDKRAIVGFLSEQGVFDVREITREVCVAFCEYLREKGLVRASILNRMKTLNAFLKFALESDLIAKNPFFLPKITALKESEQVEPFSLDEVQALIKGASGELKSYLIIAFFTGARTGELLGLKFSDIDYEKNEIHIERTKQLNSAKVGTPKTNKARVIDMLELVKNELLGLCGRGGEFVFESKSDKLHKEFTALCERVRVRARKLYNTRHSFASIMLSRGEEPAWVGLKMLGHATLSTTYKYYAKYLPKSVASRAAFVNELDLGVEKEPNLFENLA